MIRHVHIEILHRDNVDFDLEIDLACPQDWTVNHYLDNNAHPEPELIHFLVRALRPGGYAIDCGACTGFFTLVMAALAGPTGKVLAIEPGSNNLPRLRANVALNKFNVEIAPVALLDKDCMAEFLVMDNSGLNSFIQPVFDPPGEKVMVRTAALADLVHEPPDVIKIDIEGAETIVLKHWLEHGPCCPYIVSEANAEALDRFGSSIAELRALLLDHGYETFLLTDNGMMPVLVPKGVFLHAKRQNLDVLFCSMPDMVKLWPEVEV